MISQIDTNTNEIIHPPPPTHTHTHTATTTASTSDESIQPTAGLPISAKGSKGTSNKGIHNSTIRTPYMYTISYVHIYVYYTPDPPQRAHKYVCLFLTNNGTLTVVPHTVVKIN